MRGVTNDMAPLSRSFGHLAALRARWDRISAISGG
jgi:hypothetical protein